MSRLSKLIIRFSPFLLAALVVWAYEYGPDPGYTAAPGDNATGCNFTGCHTSVPNTSGGSIQIAASGGASYVPGKTQQIQVTVTDSDERKYGFELSARVDSDPMHTSAGTLSAVDGNTQVVDCNSLGFMPFGDVCQTGNSLQWIEHTQTGFDARANATPSFTYTFNWTPPSTDVGTVTLYAAGNAGRGTPATPNDQTMTHTYLTKLQLSPASGGGGSSSLTIDETWQVPGKASGAKPAVGDVFQYQITLKNTGTAATTSATLQDVPDHPAELNIQPDSQWTFSGGTGTMTVAPLAPNASRTITLSASAAAAGAYGNSVTVNWSDAGGNTGTASASVTTPVNPRPADVPLTAFESIGIPNNLLAVTAEPGGNPFQPDGASLTLAAVSDDSDTLALIGCSNSSCSADPSVALPAGSRPVALAKADLNGDGLRDYLVLNQGAGTVAVLLSGATPQPAISPVGKQPAAFALFAAGDGVPRIAVVRPADGAFEAFAWDGTKFNSHQLVYPTGNSPSAVAAGDLNGDGVDDVVVANSADNTIQVFFGDGQGGFIAGNTFAVGMNPAALALADFNGDGILDVAVANSGDNTASVLLNDGTGTLTVSATIPVIQAPAALAATDLNGDGHLDLVVANSGGASVSLFLGDGQANFAPAGAYLTGHTPVSIALADLDGNGTADIITANQGSQSLSLMLVRH
ncbi:MAG TPA: FG-GAP-like repeat-containing protein [Bryobacteraceae bacterium]|nr:FG-GAP-like repeat-containing protein [Bryobacteraceae bacterium]